MNQLIMSPKMPEYNKKENQNLKSSPYPVPNLFYSSKQSSLHLHPFGSGSNSRDLELNPDDNNNK